MNNIVLVVNSLIIRCLVMVCFLALKCLKHQYLILCLMGDAM